VLIGANEDATRGPCTGWNFPLAAWFASIAEFHQFAELHATTMYRQAHRLGVIAPVATSLRIVSPLCRKSVQFSGHDLPSRRDFQSFHAHQQIAFKSDEEAVEHAWREQLTDPSLRPFVCCRDDPDKPDCWSEQFRKKTAERAQKLKALGAPDTLTSWRDVNILEKWYAAGPPPLSEYKLTFGKHKGKRLDQVPDTYLVKYLIPRRHEGHCPIVSEAVEDYLKRNPDVRSQAGPGKTKVREGGIAAPVVKRRGRPLKERVDATTPSKRQI
jgi:hypothetical protein